MYEEGEREGERRKRERERDGERGGRGEGGERERGRREGERDEVMWNIHVNMTISLKKSTLILDSNRPFDVPIIINTHEMQDKL